ncbi:MAG: hypothetical protein H7834_04200, partial [Magnetococcus sp. YQC-9]
NNPANMAQEQSRVTEALRFGDWRASPSQPVKSAWLIQTSAKAVYSTFFAERAKNAFFIKRAKSKAKPWERNLPDPLFFLPVTTHFKLGAVYKAHYNTRQVTIDSHRKRILFV